RAVAVVIRDRDLAAEAVDEAMVRAYKRWEEVSAMSNPNGWVYRVAVNWAKTRLRRRSVRARLPIPPVPMVEAPGVPDPELVDAVRALPASQRDVVVARYLFDMSQEEIAATFEIKPGTVKSRLGRGLARLREELS
ncbi:MAG: sigma-70 family RNA polymerase sigma factor, partial [Acidimicrobiia bacterium]